ncbi:uncharacterized protein LOC143238181 [Tachypleus tridentatus]|uniref:uncharacterized protein LOC143238181 n=1 Tax=Tachypleus tridentatus TaxID=6853 RepID=UPI003FD2A208
MKEVILAILSIITSIALVLLLVCLGWYVVWKLFLSRFKLVQEILLASKEAREEESRPQRVKTRNLRME